jgi:hypothetical protein
VLGGHFQQIYFVVAAIFEMYDTDLSAYYKKKQDNPADVVKANTPIELLLEQYFMPFLVNYIRDVRVDAISIVATPEAVDMLNEFKIGTAQGGFYELAKLTKEQYIRFRNLFCEQRLCKPEWVANKNSHAMELLLRAFCMIICKKLPAEVVHPPTLHTRVRLVAPKACEKTQTAVIRLTIAKKKNDTHVRESADQNEIRQELIEIDQEEKCLAVNGNQIALDYAVTVINQSASRQTREDFIEAIKKVVPESFLADHGKTQKGVLALSE